MQLYDKDLLSVQEVRDLVEKAKKAQQEFAQKHVSYSRVMKQSKT